MKTVYIGLSKKKKFSLGSELIKWAENSKYSHVYIRIKSTHVGEYIYQATASGSVNFMGIDIFRNKNETVEEYKFEISIDKSLKMIKFFIKNAGRSYSFKQI